MTCRPLAASTHHTAAVPPTVHTWVPRETTAPGGRVLGGYHTHTRPPTIPTSTPRTTNGSSHPPTSTRSATRGRPTAVPRPLALTSQPMAFPRCAGGKRSATVAKQLGAISAAPTPVRHRQATRAP